MKTMYHLLTLLACLAQLCVAKDKPTLKCSVSNRLIEVHLVDQDFNAADHKIEYKEGGYGPKTLFIDGHQPIGTDNSIPEKSWKKFAVSWDGVEMQVTPSLYKNHFHPNINLNSLKHRNLVFIVDPLGNWVQVIMRGSDGAGAYLAGWELRRDGMHREIDPTKLFQPAS
jgi:hypothetical protein